MDSSVFSFFHSRQCAIKEAFPFKILKFSPIYFLSTSKLAKSTLILIPLFGVYYIITVGMHASNDQTMVYIRMYFELILSPFQVRKKTIILMERLFSSACFFLFIYVNCHLRLTIPRCVDSHVP